MAETWVVLFALWFVCAPLAAVVAYFLAGPDRANRLKWVGFTLVAWPFFLVLVLRRLRGRTADNQTPLEAAAPPEPRVRPVPPVSPAGSDDLSGVPEPVKACPDCGFLGIRPPGIQDGVWPGGGELIFQVCPRCDYRGLPVEFQRREEYGAFLRDLAGDDAPAPPAASSA